MLLSHEADSAQEVKCNVLNAKTKFVLLLLIQRNSHDPSSLLEMILSSASYQAKMTSSLRYYVD